MYYRSLTMLLFMCSSRFSAPRHNALPAQRLELAALRVDIAPHVGCDGLESCVAVQRQPQGIVVHGVPPMRVVSQTERPRKLGERRVPFVVKQQDPSTHAV